MTTKQLKTIFKPFKDQVKRKAQGSIPFDYLVPSGYYEEQWDWDAFFMGMALSSYNPQEAIYLKNWVLNFLSIAREDGYTPGCVTPKGRDERLNQMKPFLAQGAYYACTFLKDFSWIKIHYEKLRTVVMYREKNLWNAQYDLGVWFNSMESGADNNVAALEFPDKIVIATDLNAYIYAEYKALSLIAGHINDQRDRDHFAQRAKSIKKNINNHLWDETDNAYYNLDSQSGKLIKRLGYNCFHPLWVRIASRPRADQFIRKHALNPDELLSDYGIRTLSKSDPSYNNIKMIKPHSNWQGPIWPIANYIYMESLLQYGFYREALMLAKSITQICIDDIRKTGGMHENYDAETGEPLAAPDFISWNLLVQNMIYEAENRIIRFSLNN